ncbi:MAG: hypothetical protein F4X50_02220 [Synechococcus sp. SB0662_bin_14]|nr:hypothetical protein [Synechococcus sp. SB0662_bin_14]
MLDFSWCPLIYDECIASAPAQELESCYDKALGYAQGRIIEGCTGFNEGVIWALSKGNLQPFMPPILRRMCINHSDEVLQEELLIDDLNLVQRIVRYIIDNIRYEALEDYMESTRQGHKDATKNEEA